LAKVTTNGVSHRVKFASVPGPLVGFGRGAFLPHFDNQSAILPLFPHEQKRTVLRAYPEPDRIPSRETEPDLGLFYLVTVLPSRSTKQKGSSA
jgi:hypothetical protein